MTSRPTAKAKRRGPSGEEGSQVSLPLPRQAPADISPIVAKQWAPARVTEVFDTYWRFAAERQAVFFARMEARPPPWTSDRIIAGHRFTNAYRAADRVSQYLIRSVIYREDLPSSPHEVFFRTIIFKIFNKIETWEALERAFGAVTYERYRFEEFDDVLTSRASTTAIYSAAYIMPTGGRGTGETRKHRMHLRLVETMMRDELPLRLAGARSMRTAFELLRAYPTIGDFLAYQFVTDINYTTITNFSEMDFVVPGPGARDGLRKCFADSGGLNEAELIRRMADRQHEEFERLGLAFRDLWGRPLQLIDCQNIFCEVDKYARIAHPDVAGLSGRTRIKQKFTRAHAPLIPWFPPKWGLNEKIDFWRRRTASTSTPEGGSR